MKITSTTLKSFGIGAIAGAVLATGGAWWWTQAHRGQPVVIHAAPTIVKVPVIIYKALKAAAPLPDRAAHNPHVQVIAERRIHRRLAVATINTRTGQGALDVTPRPWFTLRESTRVGVYYGILNGAPDARVEVTQRLARLGPVRLVAQAALDDGLGVGPRPRAGVGAYLAIGAEAHFR